MITKIIVGGFSNEKNILRKVLAVSLAATMLAGTGFTTAGQFIGTNVSVSAAEKYGDFEYKVNSDDTVSIVGYKGDDENVVIPEKINGKTVTAIDGFVFWYCQSMKTITIPDSVTFITPSAFNGSSWYNSQPDGIIYLGKVLF